MDATKFPVMLGVIGALGLGCAGLLVYAGLNQLRVSELESELAARSAPSPAATPVASASGSDEVKMLRQMLQEKEAAYQRLLEESRQPKTAGDAPAAAGTGAEPRVSLNPGGRGGREGREAGPDFWERLQRDDPERYKQLQESMTLRRQQAETQYQQQLARLQERRQKAASADEAAHLDALIAAVTKLHEIGQGWESARNLSGEERRQQISQLMQESMATYQSYAELKTRDRQLQLQQLAAQAGYKDPAQAEQFTAAIKRIYEETDPGLRGLLGRGGMGFIRGDRGGTTTGTTPP